MKKIILALATLALLSCEKDETLCNCEVLHQYSTDGGYTYRVSSVTPTLLQSVNGDCDANEGVTNFSVVGAQYRRDLVRCD